MESPREKGMGWEPFPLPLLLGPGEFPWGAKPFSLGKAVAGAPGDSKLLPSEWNLDASGKALLAPTWLWRTSAGTNHSETQTAQDSTDRTGFGILLQWR